MPPKDIKDVHKSTADFTKQKRKVGKKAPEAQNVTSTKITAKSIDVPLQDLEEKNEPVNSRNLTLNDLLQQSVHYNGKVRQEAFQGLADLFTKFPDVFIHNISHLIVRFGEGMVDIEPAVRRAVCALLFQFLYLIPAPKISPFMKVCMQYLAAASSHIDAGIRADSVHFLRLFITLYPVIFRQYCAPLLPNFKQILHDRHLIIHAATSHSNANVATSLPSISVALNKMQREGGSAKRHMLKSMGASGLFTAGSNSVHAGQQGSYHSDGVAGVGAMLMHGVQGSLHTQQHGVTADADAQVDACRDMNVTTVFGMDASAVAALSSLTDMNAVHTGLLSAPLNTMSPLQTTLCLLDAAVKLHAPPVDAQRMQTVLSAFHPTRAEDDRGIHESGQNTRTNAKEEKQTQTSSAPKSGLLFNSSTTASAIVAHTRTVTVADGGSALLSVGLDPLSSLANLGTHLMRSQHSHGTRTDATIVLENINAFSTDLCKVLLDIWIEHFPPEWLEEGGRDAFEHADMAAAVKRHLDSHKAKDESYSGHKSKSSDTKEKTSKVSNKIKGRAETTGKVLSHSLSVMSFVCSILLSLARVDIALQKEQKGPAAVLTPPLAQHLPKLRKLIFPYFPFSATATHDIRMVADLNLCIAQLLAILVAATPLPHTPEQLHALMIEEQKEQHARELAAAVSHANSISARNTADAQMRKATSEQDERELAQLKAMGYLQGNNKKLGESQKRKNKEEMAAAHNAVMALRKRDLTVLHGANESRFQEYLANWDVVRDMEQTLVEYMHVSFAHHTAMEAKTQGRLQRSVERRVAAGVTTRQRTTTTLTMGLEGISVTAEAKEMEVADGEGDNDDDESSTRKRKRRGDAISTADGENAVDEEEKKDMAMDVDVNDSEEGEGPKSKAARTDEDTDASMSVSLPATIVAKENETYPGVAPLPDLLHLVWAVLPQMPPHLQTWLLETFSNFYAFCSVAPLSANKLTCVPLLCALMHLDGGGKQWSRYGFLHQLWLPSLPQLLTSLLSIIDLKGLKPTDIPPTALFPSHSSYTVQSLAHVPVAMAVSCISRVLTYAARVYPLTGVALLGRNTHNSASLSITPQQIEAQTRTVQKDVSRCIAARILAEDQACVVTGTVLDQPLRVGSTFDWNALQADWVTFLCTSKQVPLEADAKALCERVCPSSATAVATANTTSAVVFRPGALFSRTAPVSAQLALARAVGYSTILSPALLTALAFACRYSHTNTGDNSLHALPNAMPVPVRVALVETVAAASARANPKHILSFLFSAALASSDVTTSPLASLSSPLPATQIHPLTQLSHPAVCAAAVKALATMHLELAHMLAVTDEGTATEKAFTSVRDVPALTASARGELLLSSLAPLLTTHLDTYATTLAYTYLPRAARSSTETTPIALVSYPAYINIARLALMLQAVLAMHAQIPTLPSALSLALSRAIALWLPLSYPTSTNNISALCRDTVFPAQPQAHAAMFALLHSVPGLLASVLGQWAYAIQTHLALYYARTHALLTDKDTTAPSTLTALTDTVGSLRSILTCLCVLAENDSAKAAFRPHTGILHADEEQNVLTLASTQTCALPAALANVPVCPPEEITGYPPAPTPLPIGTPSALVSHLCVAINRACNYAAIARGKLSGNLKDHDDVASMIDLLPDHEQLAQFRFSITSLTGKDPLDE